MIRSSTRRRLAAVLGGAALLTVSVAGVAAAHPADRGDRTLVLCGAPGEPAPPTAPGPRIHIERGDLGDGGHFEHTRPIAPGAPALVLPAEPVEPGQCVRIDPDGERTVLPAPDGPVVIAPNRPR
ncbi:hypothetical protein [Nocardia neocaledoniensis]|uniref:hypothetical protein n=1 Tax=Nocardia neocaledoniensis TaxID=236511 RepID=UPI002454EA74|nr:hypothetical protein [Nocardia neocaledoniensis]